MQTFAQRQRLAVATLRGVDQRSEAREGDGHLRHHLKVRRDDHCRVAVVRSFNRAGEGRLRMGTLASRHRRHFDAISLRPTPGITYSLDPDYRMIWECWRGTVTLDELESFWSALSCDAEARAYRRTLADIRFSDPQFSSEQWIHLLDLFHLPASPFQGWRCAIVTSDASVGQLARQFLDYGAATVDGEIFDCPGTALAWLMRGSHTRSEVDVHDGAEMATTARRADDAPSN